MVEKSNEQASTGSQWPRRITRILLALCALMFIWYLLAERFTPYTSLARVRTFVVPVIPEVSGYVEEVLITNNQVVKAGDPLLQIQTWRFDYDLADAQAQLELATQQTGAASESVKNAVAQLAQARNDYEIFQIQAQRVLSLADTGAVAEAQVDQTKAELRNREAEVAAAEADLARAKQELGVEGENNPRIRAAVAALQEAQLNLQRTTIHAPSDGQVIDLKIDIGYYARAGEPLLTLVSIHDIWIEAYLKENNLAHIEVGDPIEINFDVMPGKVWSGKVLSLGGGASTGRDSALGELPDVESSRGWLREPQRFPVLVGLDRSPYGLGLRAGSQADVVVYTGDSWVLNGLAALKIRVFSLLSYVW